MNTRIIRLHIFFLWKIQKLIPDTVSLLVSFESYSHVIFFQQNFQREDLIDVSYMGLVKHV